MRDVFRSEPKFLAVFPSLNARRLPVGTKISGDVARFGREVFVGQNRNRWQYFAVQMRGLFSVRTEIPGDIFEFKCEAFSGKNQNPWRFFPV